MRGALSVNDLLKFWAKTTHDQEKYPNAYHPLLFHMIDVSAVAQLMWQKVLPQATRKRIERAMGVNVELAGKVISWIAGLHDLGKASPPFALRETSQNLRQIFDNTPFSVSQLLHLPAPSEAPHGYVTAGELPAILQQDFGFSTALAERIGTMIGGHHGVFPRTLQLNEIHLNESYRGNLHWQQARRSLAQELARLLGVFPPLLVLPDPRLDNATTMLLAGLVSVADWIGSNSTFFKCEIKDWRQSPTLDLARYLEDAKDYAGQALEALGWLDWPAPREFRKFEELFPQLSQYPPRHLQTVAVEIAQALTTPGIVVIEAPMGEGKTEAAIFLADHWNVGLEQRGCYFALPTQATSNQMFGRVRDFLADRYADGRVLLQLLHGHAALSAEFQTLLKEEAKTSRTLQIEGIHGEGHQQDDYCTANVAAAEWFTYRKRGLLAPFGVGTVDQALMAVLQTRHVFVRLFGLAHKTVIVDEVHAYDAYMSALLERLLNWLATLGSPVILLSATLPKERRDALVNAYLKGLGATQTRIENSNEDRYPRITWAAQNSSGTQVRSIQTSRQNTRSLLLRRADSDINGLAEQLVEALDGGGCAAVICNTVQRAQDVYEALKPFFPGNADDGLPVIDLLHARYLFKDRADRETRTLIRFGKPGGEVIDRNGHKHEVRRPNLAVLVSTQIIEQSLDLDFDLMITELAPVDLMLQRAGRLHRHQRGELDRPLNLHKPSLWICQPEIGTDGIPDFGKNKLVYDEHILLRSWLEVKDRDQIAIPTDIEELIEAVYDTERVCCQELLGEWWQETKLKMLKMLQKKEAKAKPFRILPPWDEELLEDFNRELDEDNPEKHRSLQALTRDDETPSVSVVFLTPEEFRRANLKQNLDLSTIRFLLECSVNINRWGAVEALLDKNRDHPTPSFWRGSPMLRHHRLILLDETGKQQIGDFQFHLHPALGVVIDKLAQEGA